MFPEETLRQLAQLAEEYGLLLISDEAYEKYVYEGEHRGMFPFINKDNLISIFSFLKLMP